MTKIAVTREQIDEMLAEKAREYGYSLAELQAMANGGSLNEPELRDLWIIWGDKPLTPEQD
jgi:hypothetical protein